MAHRRPGEPERPPNVVRYPAAGTTNAAVSLALLHLDGDRIDSRGTPSRFPTSSPCAGGRGSRRWCSSRRETSARCASSRSTPATGETTVVHEDHDAHWLEVVDGVPDRLPDGRLV